MMTDTQYVDIDRLLTPISGTEKCGPSLRYDGIYDAIREARRQDDGLEQGVWVTDRKMPDWKEVTRLCLDALYHRSKDLRIAAWLVESLGRQHALPGITEGLSAILHLCDGFWDCLHPGGPGEDTVADRLSVFEWINQRMSLELKTIPITAPSITDHQPKNIADLELVLQLENDARKNPRAVAGRGPSPLIAKFRSSAALTSVQFFVELQEQTEAALQGCDGLGKFLDQTLGAAAPSLLTLRNGLLGIQNWTKQNLADRPDEVLELGEGAPGPDDSLAGDDPLSVHIDAAIRNRWEAYRMLSTAADYIARTEPHSPVPYLVRRAVAWGDMSLEELLSEIVRNEPERKEIFRLLQIAESRT